MILLAKFVLFNANLLSSHDCKASSEESWEYEAETRVPNKPDKEAGSDYEQEIDGSAEEEFDGSDSEQQQSGPKCQVRKQGHQQSGQWTRW